MNIAPDIFDPSVHSFEQSPAVCKNWYRIRALVANRTPRQMAKNHLRSELGRGMTEGMILDTHGGCGNAYYSFFQEPKYPGKIKVEMYGYEDQVFSIRELLAEVKAEKIQRPLFNL